MVRFYLGTHEPAWLSRAGVPLFVSARRLRRRVAPPKPAIAPWALDSGGFTELSQRGCWSVTGEQYAEEVRRWSSAIGQLEWAATQDWMCEPAVRALTGKSVDYHQAATVSSYTELTALAPEIRWLPTIQGWEPADYVAHVGMYAQAGIDLTRLPLVGVGSVCRRQHTAEALRIFGSLHSLGIRCHGFGLKIQGLRASSHLLSSADSMAWSYSARHRPSLEGCDHPTCVNCMRFALEWRVQKILAIPGVA